MVTAVVKQEYPKPEVEPALIDGSSSKSFDSQTRGLDLWNPEAFRMDVTVLDMPVVTFTDAANDIPVTNIQGTSVRPARKLERTAQFHASDIV